MGDIVIFVFVAPKKFYGKVPKKIGIIKLIYYEGGWQSTKIPRRWKSMEVAGKQRSTDIAEIERHPNPLMTWY